MDAHIKVEEKKSIHISSGSYTEYRKIFGHYKEQNLIIQKWIEEHDKAKHINSEQTHRYSGAIGGAYTYEFTPTSLGTVARVRCSCGEVIDVSDYDQW